MNNAELFARACRVLPGGVDSPVRAFRAVNGTPFFTERGEGAFLVDAEGNRYLDYVMSWGPLLLGHAPAAVVQAVREAAEQGLTFGTPTGRETLLAEEIALAAPHMQMMRLVNSGTEATMSAVRVARGFTGREKVIKFAGNYHGHSDGLLVRAGSGCLTGGVPDSLGVPKGVAESTLVAQYNDLAGAEELFCANRGQIACVIVEPVAANMGVVPPAAGFLQGLRRLCDEHGALLIFDEVITGFRIAWGGAAEYYRVTPDLAAYGKIVAAECRSPSTAEEGTSCPSSRLSAACIRRGRSREIPSPPPRDLPCSAVCANKRTRSIRPRTKGRCAGSGVSRGRSPRRKSRLRPHALLRPRRAAEFFAGRIVRYARLRRLLQGDARAGHLCRTLAVRGDVRLRRAQRRGHRPHRPRHRRRLPRRKVVA